MDSYTISFISSAEKELRKVDRQVVPRIVEAVEELAEDPRPTGCRKLKGALHTYRIRVGDYRVIYKVDDISRIVTVQRVRHRKDAYN